MGRILVIVVVVLALIGGALFIVPQLIPEAVYKKEIEQAASTALGRQVTISGKIGLSILPRIEARAGAASIANPAGFGDKPFASMKELRAAVKLWPLLTQKVEIDEFVLVEPNIALVSLDETHNNWTFTIGGAKPDEQKPASGGFKGGSLGNVEIIDGQVSFDDRISKKTHTLSKFELKAAMKALTQPFDIKASGLADNLPFDFTAHIGDPKDLLDGKPAPVEIALQTRAAAAQAGAGPSTLLNVTYKGNLQAGAKLGYGGHVLISAPDLRQLAAVAGAQLPPGKVYRSFSLAGDASGSASNIALANAEVDFDDIQGKGDAAFDFSGKPKLTGKLATNLIDASAYATASGAPTEDAGKQPASTGWGDAPIDLSPLKLVDASLDLSAAGLKFQKFDFGPSAIAIVLKDGKLTADLKQTSLFNGKGGAALVADASQATPQVAFKANMTNLAMKPLLVAAAGFDSADGSGDLQVDITGAGANLQALMSSLAGSGNFNFSNGVLNGVDLTALVKAAKTALSTKSIPMNAFGANAQTKFSALAGTFTMKDGVATTQDMKLTAEQMTVSGVGQLDVGGQKVAFTLSPQFNSNSEGVNGFGLPIKFSGSWSGIGVSFDFDTLVQRAAGNLKQAATNELQKQIGKQLGADTADPNSKGKSKDPLKNTLGGIIKGN